MKNVFKNAKFGKAYKTKDGRKAIYFHQINGWYELIVENETVSLPYQDSGLRVGQRINDSEWPEDIVSEWGEINEEWINEVADDEAEDYALKGTMTDDGFEDVRYHSIDEQKAFAEGVKVGVKIGYYKAKEE